jgi:hypothetical protein
MIIIYSSLAISIFSIALFKFDIEVIAVKLLYINISHHNMLLIFIVCMTITIISSSLYIKV